MARVAAVQWTYVGRAEMGYSTALQQTNPQRYPYPTRLGCHHTVARRCQRLIQLTTIAMLFQKPRNSQSFPPEICSIRGIGVPAHVTVLAAVR